MVSEGVGVHLVLSHPGVQVPNHGSLFKNLNHSQAVVSTCPHLHTAGKPFTPGVNG